MDIKQFMTIIFLTESIYLAAKDYFDSRPYGVKDIDHLFIAFEFTFFFSHDHQLLGKLHDGNKPFKFTIEFDRFNDDGEDKEEILDHVYALFIRKSSVIGKNISIDDKIYLLSINIDIDL